MKKSRGMKRSVKGKFSNKSRRKISKSYRRRASKANRRNRASRKNKTFRNKRKIRKNIRRRGSRKKKKQRGGAFFLTGAVHRLPFGEDMADGFFNTETGAYNLVDNMRGHPTVMSPTPTAQPIDTNA